MPYRPRRSRQRVDEIGPVERLELAIGRTSPELEALWQKHGAALLRDDDGSHFSWPLSQLGPPDGWTEADEQARNARRYAASQ